jgi:hypothetical protein
LAASRELFYEFNVHNASQFQRYGITLSNRHSYQPRDVTFAFKLVPF